MRKKRYILVLFLITIWLTACFGAYPVPLMTTNEPISEQQVIINPETTPNYTVSPTFSITPTSPQPTLPPEPIYLTATVWQEPPQVPILMYHRFNNNPGGTSYGYTTSLNDFDGHLNALYEAGFSLVALEDWLRGEIHLTEGRRPLIITIDDLFYADQISLTGQGQPAGYTGIGHLWQFYQSHPDFNFHVALFFNLGDKTYANNYVNGVFAVGDGWRKARAEAIAWCIENDATPLNHFFDHPFLNTLSPEEIHEQLAENDRVLREDLALIGKENLASRLPNIAAIPYVVWPDTEEGKEAIYNYTSPEGSPLAGIMGGDYANNSFFFPSPYTENFDRFNVPRISASWDAINKIIDRAGEIPTAEVCDLGEFSNGILTTPGEVAKSILKQHQDGRCPEGYYSVGQWSFILQENEAIQISP
jgi:hypothetical protein